MVVAALATGGGLVLGFRLPGASAQRTTTDGAGEARRNTTRSDLNAWLVIQPDEQVIVRIAASEMGQGSLTGLAQLAAEELDCNWSRVSTELVAPEDNLRQGYVWGSMSTGNSRSIRHAHEAMRRAGQSARLMLVEAAARLWQVPAAEVSSQSGILRHSASRRRTTYGRVAALAAKVVLPAGAPPRLKDAQAWRLAGQPLASLDAKSKVNGSAVFGTDVALPGMLSAAIRAAPVPGGQLSYFEAAVATGMAGVRKVMAVGNDAVAVVADTWWQAKRALDAVAITWAPVAEVGIDSASISDFLNTGLQSDDSFVGRTHGDALAALRGSQKTLEAVYSTPFLHHATLEPMNATALWRPNDVEIWVPTQNPDAALRTAAEAAGLDASQVKVHRTRIGGGFGRRLKQDYVRQAVLIARGLPGVPVKLIWSREEDTTHGFYRPVTKARLDGGLDEKGEPTGMILRISGQSILATNLVHGQSKPSGRDPRMFQGLYAQPGEAQMGYSIPSLFIDHAMRNTHMPVGSWRGVHTTQNGIYLECFLDEMAHAAKRDPLEYRRGRMKAHPRHLAVLNAAADRAGWSLPVPDSIHRGIAQMMAVGSYAAVVAEVEKEAGHLRVRRMIVALDCGHVVNPRLVTAQVEGAVAMGLSATLHEEITIAQGRVAETNFDTYRVLRLAEYPAVDVVLVPSGDFWGGVGDAVIGAVAPAVLNAVFKATGRRIRSLPLKNAKLD